jgi:anaerobic magnesium-protoporphyrin IX monomethyl ester cyclase
MKDVVLVYPYVDPPHNRSIFRFPPLGLGYLAAYLRERGFAVDATFIGEATAIERVKQYEPRIIGVYSMFTMKEASIRFARALKGSCERVVVGGPLPTVEPESFLADFDMVAIGEGEETICQIACEFEPEKVGGIAYRVHNEGDSKSELEDVHFKFTEPNPLINDLDTLPFPARDLFDNEAYINYYKKRGIAPTTSSITSRGCPFRCDFCSRPIFGNTFRERSASNIVDEVQQILQLGYERIFFQDDCFTLTKNRIYRFCDEIERRGIKFSWECLSRVDNMSLETARLMKNTGCDRVFFGLESGSDRVLKIMNKNVTVQQSRKAVESAHEAGLKTGTFFILGYPGEDNYSMLETLHLAVRLPTDYLSFTYPYPIPGTPLYERLKDNKVNVSFEPNHGRLIQHKLIYDSEFPELKLRFGIFKGIGLHYLKRYLGPISPIVVKPLEVLTDLVFKAL